MFFAMLMGALIGFAFGRVSGAMVGAGLAAALVFWARMKLRQKLRTIQSGFLESVFAVMGALCKADGLVSRDQIQAAEALFDRFRLNASQRETAKSAFKRGTADDFDLDGELARFRQASGRQPALLQMFLQVQVTAVAANGEVHPKEHEMLVRVARGLGLSETQVEQLEALLRGAHGGGAAGMGGQSREKQLEDAYKVLGVSSDVSDAELKKAYRKLMSENHPDKLAGRGMPESMREMAEEKTQEISHAYDVIREARDAQG